MGNKFSWVGEDSYFIDQIDTLKVNDEASMQRMETEDTSTNVEKIVISAEAKRPDLRYFAPNWLLPE
jgi:hypothetical protein